MYCWILGAIFGLVISWIPVAFGNHRDLNLCVVKPTIKSRYLKPLLLTESAIKGAYSTSVTEDNREVHLIRILTAGTNLNMPSIWELDISPLYQEASLHSSGAVVVLETNKTVFWRIKATDISTDAKYTLVLTSSSQVLESFNINWDVQSTRAMGKGLQKYLKENFKALTSYTEVSQANYIHLNLGIVKGSPFRCDLKDLSHTPVAKGYKKMEQLMDGCIHENNMGKSDREVFIIELISGSYVLQQSLVPNVTLDIHPEGDEVQQRNITIILRSHKVVHWLVKTQGITGHLAVKTDSTAQDIGHHEGLSVKMSSEKLPKQFDSLVLYVTTRYGAPVAYIKTQVANIFKLLIAKKKTDDPMSHTNTQYNWKDTHHESREESQMSDIASSVEVRCENNPAMFQVTLDRSVVDSLGLEPRHLTLADPLCHAVANKTHFVLVSPMDACGTTLGEDGNFYTNKVQIRLPFYPYDDEDLEEGSGDTSEMNGEKSIIFQCEVEKTRPSFDSLWNQGHTPNFRLELPAESVNVKDPQHTKEITVGQPVVVSLKSLKRPGILVEKCWISNSTRMNSPALIHLLRHFCPVNSGARNFVSMDNEKTMQFEFQFTEKFRDFGLLFLFCQVSPCISHTDPPGEGPKCLKPHLHCNRNGLKESLAPQSTPAQEVLVSEPMRVVMESETSSGGTMLQDHKSQVVSQVLSVEVVIGIAFGSFFLGVILTGLLWCIHQRTGTTKQIQDREEEARPLRVLGQTSPPIVTDPTPVLRCR